MIQVTKEVQELIDEYNRCSLLITFFYEHPECTAQLAKQLKVKLEDVDRFIFVSRKNAIEKKLIPYVNENLHGRKVSTIDGKIGIIEHELTRVYYNYNTDKDCIICNGVSFRNITTDKETIALWVKCEDVRDTHIYTILYTIDKLTLI